MIAFRDSTDGTKKQLQERVKALERDLRTANQRLSTVGAHLAIMGPYMQSMMKAHFDVLELAQKHIPSGLALSLGVKQTMELRRGMESIRHIALPFAAEYRKIIDPAFTGDKLVGLQLGAAGTPTQEDGQTKQQEGDNGKGHQDNRGAGDGDGAGGPAGG